MSVVCLLVGVTVGYLLRGSTSSQPPASPAAVVQQQQPQKPLAMNGGVPQQPPSPEELKQMADKKVAPLLEQLNKNPKDADTLTKVGSFYFAAKQLDEATKYFERAAEARPTAAAYTNLANTQYFAGAGEKAIASLNRALQIDPKYAAALFNLGMAKWQVQGDAEGAIACWEKLRKTNLNEQQRAQVDKMIARAKEHEKMPAGKKTDKPAM
jgi:cytochrome c-type biogenesis protein CcmH/NrfG